MTGRMPDALSPRARSAAALAQPIAFALFGKAESAGMPAPSPVGSGA